ncbi:hypothetical protein BaRGS_00006187, partial [Batillaria attramentaria]
LTDPPSSVAAFLCCSASQPGIAGINRRIAELGRREGMAECFSVEVFATGTDASRRG